MPCLRSTSFLVAFLIAVGLLASPALAQPGALDPTFGDGIVPIEGRVFDVAVLPNGRLVAVGSTGDDLAAAWQFLSDGNPDLSFGNQGSAIFEVEGVSVSQFESVAPHPSGGFVAIRWETVPCDDCGSAPSLLSIYADGTLGEIWPGIGFGAWVVLTDGRVVTARARSTSFVGNPPTLCVANRYLSDGAPDPAYGDGGEVSVELGPNDEASWTACGPAAIDDSGRVTFATVGGPIVNGNRITERWGGLRLLADGTIDPTFDPVAEVPELYSLRSIAVAPDGRVTLAGVDDAYAPALVRFTEGGTLDATFGEGGVAELSVPPSNFQPVLASEPGGKLLVGSGDWVARVLADGRLDPAFGNGGVVSFDGNSVRSVSLDAGGRIVIGGNNFIARLLNDLTVASVPSVQPERLALSAPAPNPASAQTTLTYTLAEPAPVRLTVYDVLGRQVAVLAEGTRPAGEHAVTFSAAQLAPGLYVVRLATKGRDATATRRLTVVR